MLFYNDLRLNNEVVKKLLTIVLGKKFYGTFTISVLISNYLIVKFMKQTLHQSGVYNLTLNTGLCSKTLADASVTRLSLYPNPVTDAVHIAYETSEQADELIVYDMTGRKIAAYTVTALKGEWVLPVSTLASGMYVVVLQTATGVVAQQQLIKK